MTVSIQVEVLLLSEYAMIQGNGGGDKKPKNAKEWLRNKLKALASLPERLGAKVAEELPGIIGAIIS